MSKLNVFLSSAMTGELDEERAVLKSVFPKSKLNNFYKLYSIDEHASAKSIQQTYVEEVRESEILILILDKEIREAVYEEFNTAEKSSSKIFCYIKNTEGRTQDLEEFISEKAYKYHCGNFYSSQDLSGKVENDLIDDLIKTYKKSFRYEGASDYSFGIITSTGPRNEYRFNSLDDIVRTNKLEGIEDLDVDQLIEMSLVFSENYANYRDAILLLEVVLFRNPDNWMAYNNRGIILNNIGHEKAAKYNYQKTIELNPNCDSAYYNLGKISYKEGRFEEAISFYKRALKINSNKTNAIDSITASYIKLGDKINALKYARKALKLAPYDRTIKYNYISSLALNGMEDEALNKLEQFDFDLNEKLELSANIYYQNEKFDKVIKEIEKIEKRSSLDLPLCLLKLNSLIGIKEYDKAKNWLEKIVSYYPLSAADLNNIGHKFWTDVGSIELAIQYFEKSIKADPYLPNSWNNLQSILGENRMFEEALKACDEALEYIPFDPNSIRNKLVIYSHLNKPEEYTRFLIHKNLSLLGISNPGDVVDDVIEGLNNNPEFRYEYFSSFMNFLLMYL